MYPILFDGALNTVSRYRLQSVIITMFNLYIIKSHITYECTISSACEGPRVRDGLD